MFCDQTNVEWLRCFRAATALSETHAHNPETPRLEETGRDLTGLSFLVFHLDNSMLDASCAICA